SDLVGDGETAVAANVRELRRGYDRQTKLPRGLVEELARTTSLAQQEWISARRDDDYGRFRPWLERIVQLKRQEGECLREVLDPGSRATASEKPADSAYDPLLDEFEPGARTADLAALFAVLREALLPLVRSIGE